MSDVHVSACPICGGALEHTKNEHTVRCGFCDTESKLVAKDGADLQLGGLDAEEMTIVALPRVADLQAKLEAAVAAGDKAAAVRHFEAVMRVETAAAQPMMADLDYEAQVIKPAVRKFANELGVPYQDGASRGDN